MREGIEIRGRGLAGVAVGWRLWERGIPFRLTGERETGASWASAGLVNPLSGRGIVSDLETRQAIASAIGFYDSVAGRTGDSHFHPCCVLRIFADEGERARFDALEEGTAGEWDDEPSELPPGATHGGVEMAGGGWLDVRAYLRDSARFFEQNVVPFDRVAAVVNCQGYYDLSRGMPGHLPNRPAKGEILTVRVPGWQEERILIRSGWVVPLGGMLFRVGSTYEWEDLDQVPTGRGRERLEALLKTFTGRPFEIVDHVAGVRPIIRRSEPFWGKVPGKEREFFLNGLGSKGCISAPEAADKLASELLENW